MFMHWKRKIRAVPGSQPKLLDFLLFFSLALMPVYTNRSGLPQLSDYLFGAFIFTAALSFKRLKGPLNYFKVVGAFVLLSIIVNLSWALFLGEPEMVIHGMFYLFNGLVLISLVTYLVSRGDFGLKILFWGMFTGVMVTLVFLLNDFNFTSLRQTAGFNNPNQLAYYGLLLVGIAALIKSHLKLKVWAYWGIVMLGISFVLLGASLVGMVGAVIMISGVALIEMRRPLPFMLTGLFIGIAVMVIGRTDHGNHLVNQLLVRQDRAVSKLEDTIDERGWKRLTEYPAYMFLGQGKGVLQGSERAFNLSCTRQRLLSYFRMGYWDLVFI